MQKTRASASRDVGSSSLGSSPFLSWDLVLTNFCATGIRYELNVSNSQDSAVLGCRTLSTHHMSEWMCFVKWTYQEGERSRTRLGFRCDSGCHFSQVKCFLSYLLAALHHCMPFALIVYFTIAGPPWQGSINVNGSKEDALYDSDGTIHRRQILGKVLPDKPWRLSHCWHWQNMGRQPRLVWFRTDDYCHQKFEMYDSDNWVSLTLHASPRGKALVTNREPLKLRAGIMSQIKRWYGLSGYTYRRSSHLKTEYNTS